MKKSIRNLLETGDLSGITTYQACIVQANFDRLLQKYCDEILKPYGITKVQWLIIGSVLDSGDVGMRITDLADLLGTGLPFLTNTVNTLQLKKILTRDNNSGDSRSKLIRIHPTFRPKCAEIEQRLRDQLRVYLYAHIKPVDFHSYMRVLYQLVESQEAET